MRIRQWLISAFVFMPAGLALSLSLTGQDLPSRSERRLSDDDSEAVLRLLEKSAVNPDELRRLSAEQLQLHCRKAMQERVTALRAHVDQLQLAYDVGSANLQGIGRVDIRVLANAASELARAEAEVATTRAERVAAMTRWYNAARQVEDDIRAKTAVMALGGGTAAMSIAVANRLTAEVALTSELAARDVPLKP